MSNLLWKIATAVAVFVSVWAIKSNNEDIRKLENQVCDTVVVQIDTIPTLEYYKDPAHADERDNALREARSTLARFHCEPGRIAWASD